ncbi:MAG: outer membrane protein assembly factor BamB family protein, partial [Planctomycetota bacterium]
MTLQGNRSGALWVWLWVVVASTTTRAGEPTTPNAEAEAALNKLGIEKGICAVLGLPNVDRPQLVAGLAAGSDLVVYFQSPEEEETRAVRAAAEAAGLLGKRVFVDRGPWGSIHLADNLAGAVLVSDRAEGSVGREVLRVLHPAGKAVFSNSKEVVKPFPKGIDPWSYPYHGADNNPQSRDRIARAPYLTQFLAEPKFCPSPAVTVAAGGRMFRACGHLAHRANQNAMVNTLLAMNAFNGTVLWKRPLSEGFMILRNTVVATPQTLYLADDKSCKLLDAATGRVTDEIIPPEADRDGTVWKWMAVEGDVVYGLIGGEEFKAPVLYSESFGVGGWPRANWPGFDYADPKTAWAQGRALIAVDTKSKKLLWRHREDTLVDGRAVCMAAGRIFLLSPEKSLGCVDAETGDVLWRNTEPELLEAIGPVFSEQPRWTGLSPFPYVRCNDKFVFFSGPRIPRIVAVSTETGKLLWKKDVPLNDAGSVHLLLRDDGLYAVGQGGGDTSFRMDYRTGETREHFIGRRACTMATGTADSIFYRATGGTVRIDLASNTAEHIAPMRPPCYEGVIASEGFLYWGAWKCRCQISLYGHVCL